MAEDKNFKGNNAGLEKPWSEVKKDLYFAMSRWPKGIVHLT
jgi:hypothetical protein